MINFNEDQHCTQANGTKVRYRIFEETLTYMSYKGKRQHIPDEFGPMSIENMAEIFTSSIDAEIEELVKVRRELEEDKKKEEKG